MKKVDGRFEKMGDGRLGENMSGLIGDTPPIFGIV